MAKSRSFLQMGLALVLALVAGFLTLSYMSGKPKTVVQTEVVAPETTMVAVASEILSPGTRIDAVNQIKLVPYLNEALPESYFGTIEELDGRVVLAPLRQNEPITESRLAAKGITLGGISALVRPGYRAVAVHGNKVLGMSGFIRPGNMVDVLVTLDRDDVEENITETKVVLEDIKVLATGEELQPADDGLAPSPVDVYTLEVSPAEAERLALAATKGTLHFALRNAGDRDAVLTEGANVERTLSFYRQAPPPPKPQQKEPVKVVKYVKPVKETFKCEVITGNQKNVVAF